jgi:cold shock CspA family protein
MCPVTALRSGILDTSPPFLSERTGKMTENKVVGRVIKVSKDGWGFISSKEIQFTRIFFHWTALKQDTVPFLELKTGMMVEFTPIQVPGKGYRAIHVRVIETEKNDKDTPNDAGITETEMPALPE